VRSELPAGRAWLSGLSLDVRLGVRMLVKHPGLTVIGGLGMAVAIAIAAISFGMIYALMDTALPVPDGDRVVMIQNFDARISNPNRATHLHDLATWREQLRSVRELGAFRNARRNLLQGAGDPELIRIAELSAAGFTVARTPPLLGRPLLEADEQLGAADVVVIGEEAWRNRFTADVGIVGRTIRLGAREHTVVGVMPAHFRFPVNHQYWIPLRLNAADYERGAAPDMDVFGRLADGASLNGARTEVETIRRRLATSHPDVYARIRPQVMPYTLPFFDLDSPRVAWAYHLVQALVTLLLVIVGGNIAILMYARTTARLGEITVRTALGASRRRIVLQLFAEALVLSSVAAAVGLAAAALVLRRLGDLLRREFGDELPFWLDPGLSPGLTAYGVGLAILAALIIGAAPALQATGRRIERGLRSLGAGGGHGLQLGRTWTLLIVAQVAVAMAVLPAAVHRALESAQYGMTRPGYAASEYLQARLSLARETPPAALVETYERQFQQQFADATLQLVERLLAEPAVAEVTFAGSLPTSQRWIRIDVDAAGGRKTAAGATGQEASSGHLIGYSRVAENFFDAFDLPVLAGRAFAAGDATDAATAVIVNRTFVERVLGGGSALGRTIRYSAPSYEWDAHLQVDRQFEIVGVVADFPHGDRPDGPIPAIYGPLAAGQSNPTAVIVRLRGTDASGFVRRFRALALATNGALEVDDAIAMDDAGREFKRLMRMIALVVIVATLSVMLLSAAGIYAMMSFTVARRRREIGIRAALGAPPAQLLGAVFRRAAAQLGAGVLVGLVLAAGLDLGWEVGYATLLAPVAVLMLTVGLVAAAGPARRGLRIQPTEALRDE
jgi:putative ABC transport system permease protein